MKATTEPQRTCVGCGVRGPASSLLRIRADADGRVFPGAGSRGAWLCEGTLGACFASAVKRRAFSRALRCNIDSAAEDRLGQLLHLGQQGAGPPRSTHRPGSGRGSSDTGR